MYVAREKAKYEVMLFLSNSQYQHFVYPANIYRGRINTNALQHSQLLTLYQSKKIISSNTQKDFNAEI